MVATTFNEHEATTRIDSIAHAKGPRLCRRPRPGNLSIATIQGVYHHHIPINMIMVELEVIDYIQGKGNKRPRATGSTLSVASGARKSAAAAAAPSEPIREMPMGTTTSSICHPQPPLAATRGLVVLAMNAKGNWQTVFGHRTCRMGNGETIAIAKPAKLRTVFLAMKLWQSALVSAGGKGLSLTTIVPNVCNVINHGCRVPDVVIHRRIFKIKRHTHMQVGT